LRQLDYQPPVALRSPPADPDKPPQMINSRADLDALLDAISLSGVSSQPAVMSLAANPSTVKVVPTSPRSPEVSGTLGSARSGQKHISYADFMIDDPRQKDGTRGYTISDSAPKPPPDLSGYVAPKPAALSPAVTRPPAATTTPIPSALAPTQTPSPTPAPYANDPWSDIENADIDDLMKNMPKWTKGPPGSSEEIDEYKKFMVVKYEAEQKLNAEILRRKKLGKT
jgi:hypothetical protein